MFYSLRLFHLPIIPIINPTPILFQSIGVVGFIHRVYSWVVNPT